METKTQRFTFPDLRDVFRDSDEHRGQPPKEIAN